MPNFCPKAGKVQFQPLAQDDQPAESSPPVSSQGEAQEVEALIAGGGLSGLLAASTLGKHGARMALIQNQLRMLTSLLSTAR